MWHNSIVPEEIIVRDNISIIIKGRRTMKTNRYGIAFALSLTLICITLNTGIGQSKNTTSKNLQNFVNDVIPSTLDIQQIYFFNPLTGWAYGPNGVLLKTTNGGSQWFQQNSSTNNFILKVFFIDANIGWACGYNGTLLKTTNGGNAWTPLNSGTTINLLSVFFANPQQGWIAVGDSGIILSTQNGGTNWQRQTSGVDVQLRDTKFSDANHGWICGDSGTIVHTSNGGINWISQNSQTTTYLWWIDFTDSLNGYVAGGRYADNSTIFLKTTDGGITWVHQTPTSAYSSLFSTDFINADTGWVVGRYGTILKTTDGGNNWSSQSYGDLWFTDVYFMNKDTGYVLNPGIGGKLLTTTNGGNSWNSQNINITKPLFITDVPNDNGKQVFIKWTTAGSPINLGITNFSIYRYDQQAWTYIKDVPVLPDSVYQTIVPTLYDSTITQGLYNSIFQVVERTADPSVCQIIGPDSGYSVDNLPPLAPANASMTQLINGNVIVQWQPVKDIYGDFKDYVLYRSLQSDFVPSQFTRIAYVHDTIFTDLTAQGNRFYYKITSRDYSGNESQPLSPSSPATSVDPVNSNVPQTFGLSQNYPNPFNPSTTIGFQIAKTSMVSLKIFDLLGREVVALVNGVKPAGIYTAKFNAVNLPSGIYFYRLQASQTENGQADTFTETKRLLLLK